MNGFNFDVFNGDYEAPIRTIGTRTRVYWIYYSCAVTNSYFGLRQSLVFFGYILLNLTENNVSITQDWKTCKAQGIYSYYCGLILMFERKVLRETCEARELLNHFREYFKSSKSHFKKTRTQFANKTVLSCRA